MNDVLVLAAQSEIERLQDQVGNLSTELRSLQQQQQHLQLQQATAPEMTQLAEENNDESAANGDSENTNDGEEGKSASKICSQCSALQQQTARLSSAMAEASSAKDIAEEQLAKTKEKFNEMQSAQLDVVKLSQDERLQAEARCEEAEIKATREAKRAEQLSIDLKTFKERAEKAEAALQQERSKVAAKADASAAHQRARTTELEMATSTLSQQLASSQAQVSAL